MAKKVVVILADGFEEIEAVSAIDVLRRAELEVTVAGLSGTTISGSHQQRLVCDVALDDLQGVPDAVVLPGGMPGAENLGNSEAVASLVEKVVEAGGICGAICAAPAMAFAKFGLLDGRSATCYPGFESQFGSETRHREERVVVDGNVVTSRAPGTAMEFSLKLVELLAGGEVAAELRERMLVSR